jgi:N utilization substance protein A
MKMGTIKLNANTLSYIPVFETATGVDVIDCMERDDSLFFIVPPLTMRKVLRNKGENIHKLRNMFNKNITVIEYSQNPEQFIKNIFYKYSIREINIEKVENRLNVTVTVDPKKKGFAIGKNGKNLHLAKEIIQRHYPLENLSIM